MPVERFAPDDPRAWLNRARSDLRQAEAVSSGVYLEDLCFHAHQAAEKAIRAVLIGYGLEAPDGHDVAWLLTLLEQAGEVMPGSIDGAAALTRFAVETRHPGVAEPVSTEEYEQAVATANAVVRWAELRVAALLFAFDA